MTTQPVGRGHRAARHPAAAGRRGWGRIDLATSAARAGKDWTDDGTARQQRGLKHRAQHETRSIPIPPVLVRLLRARLKRYGAAPDGRIFFTVRGGLIQDSAYIAVWQDARAVALPPAQQASLLAGRPYDLRHAGVSLALNAGCPPPKSPASPGTASSCAEDLRPLHRNHGQVRSAARGQTSASIVRRIRELVRQASAGHVSGQHVVSKVILNRFAGVSGPDAGLLYPFRLRYPDARHRLLGLDGCGKVPDFISYASGSAERLWKQTEDRLHDPLAALDNGTLPVSAMHQAAIKDAIALHYARSTAARIVHFGIFVRVYVACSSRRRRGSPTIETC